MSMHVTQTWAHVYMDGHSHEYVHVEWALSLLLSLTHTHAHTLPPRTSSADHWTCGQGVRGLAGLLLLGRRFVQTRQAP